MAYKVEGIIKYYGDLKVLDKVTIDFEPNKTTCILGPSGCGKTTLLNIIAGLIPMDSGQIIGFDDERISYVFQEDRLIKWKNVKENLEFVLKGNVDKNQIEIIIDKYLKLVSLEEYKYYYPKDLSGGMKQRVSILRAFLYPSSVLLMDEPFKSLDVKSKSLVIEFFKELRSVENKTCILVTHNIEEALELGDKIVILTQKPTRVRKVVDKNIMAARELIESYFKMMP